MKPAPVYELLTGNANILMESAQVLRTREDRPIEAHLLARTKRNPGSARSHDHRGTFDDSAKVTLTWSIKSDVFSISLKLLDKSLYDFNTVLANKLQQACMNILEAKETEAIAYLVANKATQQPTLSIASYNAGTGAVEVPALREKQFFQVIKSVMKKNYFPGQLDVIADSVKAVDAEFLAAQGAGNATNFGYQFGGMNIAESIEYTDDDYADKGSVLVMPAGTVGALEWIPKQNRQGFGDYNSYNGGYGVFSFMGHTFALHGYSQRSDTSGSNGATQDMTMEFELSLDTSYNRAPLPTTSGRTDSVIIQVGQLS